MHLENRTVPSLGILHILEDALSVLQGRPIDADRRQYVLKEARELVDSARERAEDVLSASGHVVDPKKWRNMQSYTLLSRYIDTDLSQPNTEAVRKLADVLE